MKAQSQTMFVIALFLALIVTVGCEGNATNEPSATAIEKANVDRAKAIDNDPSLNLEEKTKMKEMMKLGGPQTK